MPLCTIVNCSQQVKRSDYSLFGTCEAASALSSFRYLSSRKMLRDCSKSREEAARIVHAMEERTRQVGLFSLERCWRGNLTTPYSCQKERHRDDSQVLPRRRILKISCTDSMRSNWHNLKNFRCKDKKVYHRDGRTPEQVAQKGCGITTFGDTIKFSGQFSQQLDLIEWDLCTRLRWWPF